MKDLTTYETTLHKPMRVLCDATVRHEARRFATAGFALCNHNGRLLDRDGRHLGVGYRTEQAEFESMQVVLELLSSEPHVQHLNVYSDSVGALSRSDELEAAFCDDFEYLTFDHIPRTSNTIADVECDVHAGDVRMYEQQKTKYGLTD